MYETKYETKYETAQEAPPDVYLTPGGYAEPVVLAGNIQYGEAPEKL